VKPRALNTQVSAKLRLLVLVGLAAGLLTGCFPEERASLSHRVRAAYTEPAAIADWIIQGRNDYLLIDLRAEADFRAGHIPGAITLGERDPASPTVIRSLPSYKKLVFYQAQDIPDDTALLPVFRSGAHVLILSGGYSAWQAQVLAPPAANADPIRVAVGKHFRGESALGEARAVKAQGAEQYLQEPTLPIKEQPLRPQVEGC
jgi:hypothetical protein